MQRKLSALKIFDEQFLSVRESLRMAVAICEQWVLACEHLTGQVRRSCYFILKFTQAKAFNSKIALHASMEEVNRMPFVCQVWKRHAPHPWHDDKHCPQTLQCLAQRLDEVSHGSVKELFMLDS